MELTNTPLQHRGARPSDTQGTSKLCSCGRVHDAEGWRALPLLGLMRHGAHAFELRNCVCGSTLGIEVTRALA